jgi:hypothetical protein
MHDDALVEAGLHQRGDSRRGDGRELGLEDEGERADVGVGREDHLLRGLRRLAELGGRHRLAIRRITRADVLAKRAERLLRSLADHDVRVVARDARGGLRLRMTHARRCLDESDARLEAIFGPFLRERRGERA